MDGKYNLANVPENSTLEISYIGYKTQSLKATDKSLANITLHEDTEVLDEVVVVGYTPMRKSDFTGSLASVKANELSLSAATAGQALVGKVAGVQVMQTMVLQDKVFLLKSEVQILYQQVLIPCTLLTVILHLRMFI